MGDIHDRTARQYPWTDDIFFTVHHGVRARYVLAPRRLRQPVKFFVIGFASGAIAALLSALAMARGTVSSRAFLFVIAISIVVGAVISLLASSETISEKRRDELVRKSDDQSWRL